MQPGTDDPTGSDPPPGPSSAQKSPSADLAAGATEVAHPRRLQAAPSDIQLAGQAEAVTVDPPPASPAEIDQLRHLVVPPGEHGSAELRVMQWQPEWVQYDGYFRPVILNVFPDPLKLVYEVEGRPRVVVIPPLARVVSKVPEPGSHNFTAMRVNVLGLVIDVAVGNFYGGGYSPEPGQPPPTEPVPARTLTGVPVQVKYANAASSPIVVRKLVDAGADPAVGGEQKVLLDGVTPAWGEWKRNDAGVPQFEIHKTQSLPGMEAPAEGPLPGYHDLQLLASAAPADRGSNDGILVAAAIVGIGAIVVAIFPSKRRRPQG